MNPYKEDGLRARLSFDPAYCKRCTGASSVNDGYIAGPGAEAGAAHAGRTAAAPSSLPAPQPGGTTLSSRLKLSFGSAATRPL